jgi:hypothetical protein
VFLGVVDVVEQETCGVGRTAGKAVVVSLSSECFLVRVVGTGVGVVVTHVLGTGEGVGTGTGDMFGENFGGVINITPVREATNPHTINPKRFIQALFYTLENLQE